MSRKVILSEKLAQFYFSPRTVAEFNGHDIMVTKLRGPFVWHKHDDTDDFFLVLHGRLEIELRDQTISGSLRSIQYIAEHNTAPKPFVWTANPDRILAAINRGKQVMELVH